MSCVHDFYPTQYPGAENTTRCMDKNHVQPQTMVYPIYIYSDPFQK